MTAFPTRKGLMEFRRLPFGLVTACSTYARLMTIVLSGLPNVCFYFDNVYVYSNTWEDHMSSLRNVLSKFQEHGLTERPSKCKIGFRSIDYLGFKVGNNNLTPLSEKVGAILQMPLPCTKNALLSFLGMVSFYRKFIKNASDLTALMSDMLKKEVLEPLPWSSDASEAFGNLKLRLSRAPVLRLPDKSLQFVLRTDASNLGLGAVLWQYHDGVAFPVAFASRKLLDCERRYSTIERECLAIVYGIEMFKFYLTGQEFLLEVDHTPLVYLNRVKGSNLRLMRWALSLQSYRHRVVHIAGKDNVGAVAVRYLYTYVV